jgi:acyl-CoA thioester hydrolase
MSDRYDTPFHTRVRVRYAETDKLGIAYNSHFLVWFEVGRTELLRNIGLTYEELERGGFHFPLLEAGVRYLKPALYDDVLIVESTVREKPGVRVRIDYEVIRGGEVIATGFTVHALTDNNLRPARPPANVREKLRATWEASLKLKQGVHASP